MEGTVIVFRSRTDAAGICGRRLFDLLNGSVDICCLDERTSTPDISEYRSVIIGGVMHNEEIESSVYTFCEMSLEQLLVKNVGLFVVSGFTRLGNKNSIKKAYPKELADHAIVMDCFRCKNSSPHANSLQRFFLSDSCAGQSRCNYKLSRFAEIINRGNEE